MTNLSKKDPSLPEHKSPCYFCLEYGLDNCNHRASWYFAEQGEDICYDCGKICRGRYIGRWIYCRDCIIAAHEWDCGCDKWPKITRG